MNAVAMSPTEETLLGLLIMTIFWAIFSGACVVATTQARELRASWFWATSFLATSLVAAYCFGRLL